MLLIDGQAGVSPAGLGGGGSNGLEGEAAGGTDWERAPVYGLTVSGPGLVPYVDPVFRVEAGMASLDVVVEAPSDVPSGKAASSDRILGDVDNTGGVDFFDALLVALYSLDASIVMPNNGDITLGDVNADDQVDLSDAWAIAAWLNDPSDPALPAGIGKPVGASLSPDPRTVTFSDDGAWHRFTVRAGEPVSVVVNPGAATPRLEISIRGGRGNYCPAEADDDAPRRDGQALYLSGCAIGEAMVEVRRESDGTVLNSYTFEVTGSPADLVVESVSVSDSTLTPGQSFTLRAMVRNQGTGQSAATTLRYYRSSNRTISTRDTQVGTDAIGALGASRTRAESIRLAAPSREGTYYYGACVVPVSGEASPRNNCSPAVRLRVAGTSPSSDRDALVALYHATDGPDWTNSTNWLSDSPLGHWHGVLGVHNGRVTRLNLQDNNLRGPLPTVLVRLTNLESLSLSGNQLTGEIPPELGRLTNLSSLNLGWNLLTGTIPPELGQLTNLSSLSLGWNPLTGTVPSELGQLTNLSSLSLGWTQLTGTIPSELGQLTNLESLDLRDGQLEGEIPAELARLASLTFLGLSLNELTGEIPSELGRLTNLRLLDLSFNRLTGEIPPELERLTNLQSLNLRGGLLAGEIPSGLARLANLTFLGLGLNQLTGEIPSELGRLTSLKRLDLSFNQLEGEIPSELGQLANLAGDPYDPHIVPLDLSGNQLTGEIPPELGQLTNLSGLNLSANRLTGEIPSELGRLTRLSILVLSTNQLTGEIPAELGRLTRLSILVLSTNQLTGEIPPELGRLTNLSDLDLSSNQLTGNLPPELGDLGNLRSLNLAYNGALSGTLSHDLTRLTLQDLSLQETFLCPPQTPDFQSWLFGIPASRVRNCAPVDASTAYLTQATQSLGLPVPLVAGEAALLRVFVTAGQDVEATMPPVRATFYQDGAPVHTAEMEGRAARIPWQVNEADLSSSANAVVPGPVVMPGLEMVVEIDPDRTLGVGARLPATGRTALNVRSVPPFDLTLVPFLWTENPDSTVLTRTEGLTAESELFRPTRDLLPVGDFSLTVHEPVWTSVDPTSDANVVLGPETELIHAMEGASGHYMGIFRREGRSALRGQALTPGYVSLSVLDANVMAHELGHNLSLDHAPACGAWDPDPEYPHEDGSIGVWGYDFLNETLVSPATPDIMTFCNPQWISVYSFAKALDHRSRSASPRLAAKYPIPPRGLLLWGGLNQGGELFLEPAFVVGAPPLPPRLDGPYRLTGEDEEGNEVFSRSFGMAEFGCGGRGGSFAFILPVGRDWPDRLARIVLSGPEGVSILDAEEDPSATLLLDRATGRVRGILRGRPEGAGKRWPYAVRCGSPGWRC